MRLRELLRKTPVLGAGLAALRDGVAHQERYLRFPGSARYWERRYAAGHTSGAGSYGRLAAFKADVINDFVHANDVKSVVEFGCGDGNQLVLMHYPLYLGLDVSATAVRLCRRRFASDESKRFMLVDEYNGEPMEVSVSLDVIFHLVEDDVYREYLERLFASATRFVIIYSSDTELDSRFPHVRHRKFTSDVQKWHDQWQVIKTVANRYPIATKSPNESSSEFVFYARKSSTNTLLESR